MVFARVAMATALGVGAIRSPPHESDAWPKRCIEWFGEQGLLDSPFVNNTKPTRVLITGFEPFGGSTLNPSQAIIEAIESKTISIAEVKLCTALLPVDTSAVYTDIASLWKRHDPDVVLHLGESARADRLTLERVALNLLDFDLPDNTGKLIHDEQVDPTGPPARFVTLPVRVLQDRLGHCGIQTTLSLSAGAYLPCAVSVVGSGPAAGRADGGVYSRPLVARAGEKRRASSSCHAARAVDRAGPYTDSAGDRSVRRRRIFEATLIDRPTCDSLIASAHPHGSSCLGICTMANMQLYNDHGEVTLSEDDWENITEAATEHGWEPVDLPDDGHALSEDDALHLAEALHAAIATGDVCRTSSCRTTPMQRSVWGVHGDL